jgi:peptide deformylase
MPIRQVGDPVLRTAATRVERFDSELAALVDRMWASMRAAEGIGLAANQIGIGLAVFVYDVDTTSGVVVNPTLVETSGELVVDGEGCLSVVGQVFDTPRPERAVVVGQDVDGQPIEVSGDGLLGRCLQHETDHLLGRLYIDLLSGRDRRRALRAAQARERVAAAPRSGAFGL